ncbi:MAG: DUF6531 domain-containing protein [Deltaproteobacteria bacterium]|nr:DUF6531 domain-containing protein [Deltaproteobacteria bacterium]
MLVSTHFDPVIGLDIHIVLVPTPGGPVPTPLPFPFVGLIWKPPGNPIAIAKKLLKEAPKRLAKAAAKQAVGMGGGVEEEALAIEEDFLSESLGEFHDIDKAAVQVNHLPATHTGDEVKALVKHIPAPGPFQKPPSDDAELLFGGLNVSFGGAMVVRLGEIAMSCFDPTGRAPVSTVLAIPKGPLVLVMRPPVPDLKLIAQKLKDWMKGKLQKLAAKLKFKLFKKFRRWQKRSLRWKKLSNVLQVRMGKRGNRLRSMWNRKVCRTTGHPVDVATGRMFTDNVDFALPGPMPLSFERVYDSSLSSRRGPLGHGWFHNLDVALTAERGAMVLRSEDGREIEFSTWHLPDRVLQPGMSLRHPIERSTLSCIGPHQFELATPDGLIWSFGRVPGSSEWKALTKRQRDGAGIGFFYNAQGLLESVLDSAQRRIIFAYDRAARLMSVAVQTAPEATPVTQIAYQYDGNDDLIVATDALGGTWRYEYQCHLMVQETNRNGLSFYFVYDSTDESARCVRTWGDDGIYDHVITYTDDSTLVENSLGEITLYKQDETGQIVSIVDATGAETKYEYDENTGQQSAEISPDGTATRWTFDAEGNCTQIVGPDGATLAIEHNDQGLPVKVVDALGGVWQWSYDGMRHLVGRRDPLGRTQQYEWSGPFLVAVTDPTGQRSQLQYDAAGNLILLRAPDGTESRWHHDAWGRCVAATDAKGNTQHRQFDALGRLVLLKEPDGNERQLSYDPEGNVIWAKDVQHEVRFTYQGMNRLRKREEAGTTIRFAYDKEERLLGVQNEHQKVYQFVLGPTGLVTEEWGFDGLKRTYLRDPMGRVTQVIRPLGETSAYKYDKAGRVLEVEHSDGTKEEFAYRVDGAMVKAANAHAVVAFERDVLGRVTKELQGNEWVASEYSPAGFRTRIRSSKGLSHQIRRNGMGDVLGLSAHVERGGSDLPFEFAHVDGAGANAYEARFDRDSVGMEIARHLPGGVSARWERDNLGRPVRQSIEVNGQEVRARVYRWEPNDRLKQILDSLSGPIRFEHDALGSLVSATFEDAAENAVRQFRLPDAVGNLFRSRERDDRKYGPGGALLESRGPDGVTKYEYDPEGNLVRKLTPAGEWKYTWSGAGRLVCVVRPDGSQVKFGYDALGRRVWKQWRGKRTRWVWDGNVPLHEWVEHVVAEDGEAEAGDSAGADRGAQARQAALLLQQPAQGPPSSKSLKSYHLAAAAEGTAEQPITWLFEPESFTPLAKLIGEDKFSIVADHLGVPTSMVDELGRVVWQAEIGIWGDLRDVQGVKAACPFRWPGQYEDEEVGLYYNRFRYYDAEGGQYVSQDPIGLDGGWNQMGYVKDTLRWVDPLGLACKLGKTTGSYDAMNPGPLPEALAGTFAGGRYKEVVLSKDTVLYRAGENGKPLGQFFDTVPPKGVIQTRIDKAVLPSWPGGGKSPIDSAFAVKIPAGTKVYVGEVGSQGGHFVGGGKQIVVQQPWNIPGVQVLGQSPLL